MVVETALITETVIDYRQTGRIIARGQEANPIIGARGDRLGRVPTMLLGLTLQGAVACVLPPSLRLPFEMLSVGWEGSVVTFNYLSGWGW